MGGFAAGAGVNATIVVPARLASTRLPEKVLLAQTGRPMVQHVADAATLASCAARSSSPPTASASPMRSAPTARASS
ncbi:MAG: hypothetical protein QM783_09295 [Phycisphaerales bacterium]